MLEIENLVKHYKDFHLNCTLKVSSGSITGLAGENGAGKSTIFKAILGLIPYESGSITLFGKAPEQLSAEDKQRIGVTLAESGFSGYLKVKEAARILEAMYPGFDRNVFVRRCSELGIPTDKYIREFSTGMKAKLKVLTAISHGADFLLMDEPTAGMDVMARESILNLFREYMEEDENRSILISSHISSDLEGLCDDVYMIHKGSIILHEEMDALLNRYGLIKVSDDSYGKLDKNYLLAVKKANYGYACLTDQRQYYLENYPGITLEKGSLDEVISMMTGGTNG